MVRGLPRVVPGEGAHRARALHERVPAVRALAPHVEMHQVRARVDAQDAHEAVQGVPGLQEPVLEQGEDAEQEEMR